MTMRLTQPVAALMVVALLPACVTSPPKQVDNVCHIFREKSGWYGDAKESRARWGVPVSVSMAFMHQESRFVATAKPPRKKLWGVIPGPRPSDAYGYSQAKDSTWEWYQRSTGNYGADRDDFGDAIDFVGWYNNVSHKELGIDKQDAFRLYLAYHEGHGGYRKQSYRSKDWLVGVARKVDRQARRYNSQLQECSEELEPRGWFDWW
ncbi:hypothetical protein N9U42_03205 [Luminiphilus sp.]|nr:transglycosylase SLT domain-containing protein [Luminiphilus sp.]MDA9711357.1 hypothetical protein [Luminiphilus sp.]